MEAMARLTTKYAILERQYLGIVYEGVVAKGTADGVCRDTWAMRKVYRIEYSVGDLEEYNADNGRGASKAQQIWANIVAGQHSMLYVTLPNVGY